MAVNACNISTWQPGARSLQVCLRPLRPISECQACPITNRDSIWEQHYLLQLEPGNNLINTCQEMTKKNILFFHNGILHSLKKRHLNIYRQVNGSRKHQIERINPDPERQLSYVLTHKCFVEIKRREATL